MKKLIAILVGLCLTATFVYAYDYVNQNGEMVSGNRTHNISMSYNHHKIHEGEHFFLSGVFKDTASGVTKTFGVSVPTNKSAHMVYALSSSGEMEFKLYEGESGSTFYNGGTAQTPLNNDRRSSTVSALTIVSGVNHVVSGVSTLLVRNIHGGSGNNPQQLGTPGGGGRDAEIIFAPGKKYLVIMTSSAADNNMDYNAEWYEEDE